MDDVLPPLSPDWDNPQRYDGPTPEEVNAFSELRATADAVRFWVVGAHLHSPGPEGWAKLGERLTEAAKTCADLATDLQRTVAGEVEQP